MMKLMFRSLRYVLKTLLTKNTLDKRSGLQLGMFLTYLMGELEVEKNESNKEEISPIIEGVKNLNKSLFQLSKDVIKSKLKNIFDKIKKYSPPFFESIFKGFKSELPKGIVTSVLKSLIEIGIRISFLLHRLL